MEKNGNPWADFDAQQQDNPWADFDAQRSELDKERKAIDERGIMADIGAWMTGADREPNIPVLGFDDTPLDISAGAKATLAALINATPRDDRLKAGIAKIIPDAQFDEDKFGNLVVIAPSKRDEQGKALTWQRFYPNPKGLDLPTTMQIAGAASLAKPAQLLARALGLPTTGYLGAGTVGGIEGTGYELGTASLTGTPFEPLAVPAGVVGGMAGKGVIDLSSALGRSILSKYRAMTNPSDPIEQLSANAQEAVRQAVRESGGNVDDIPPETMNQIVQDVLRGIQAGESVAARQAQGLPTPIPLTQGEVTGSPARTLIEGEIEKGVYGQTAQNIIQGTRAQQREAIQQNVPQIQEQVAGGQPVVARGEGGAGAQAALAATREAEEQAISEAYKGARAQQAFVPPEEGAVSAETIAGTWRQGFSDVTAPKTASLLGDVEQKLAEGASVRDLFDLRQQLTNLSKELGTEGSAAGQAKALLDAELERMANNSLLYGSTQSVQAWLQAIGLRREFAKRWESTGILKLLTEREMRDGQMVLKVSPEEAANAILGKSQLFGSKTNFARDLTTLRNQLGPDSAEWSGIRQEFTMKLFDQLFKSGGIDRTTGVSFRKAWNELSKNKTLVNTMLTAEERNTISSFANTVALIDGATKNFSNSGAAVAAKLDNLLPKLAIMAGGNNLVRMVIAHPLIASFKNAYGTAQALSRDIFSPVTRLGETQAAGVGALATEPQDYVRLRNLATGANQ